MTSCSSLFLDKPEASKVSSSVCVCVCVVREKKKGWERRLSAVH